MARSKKRRKPAPKKGGRKPKLTPELVAARLVIDRGNLAAVARHFGVSRAAVFELVGASPALKQVLKDAREAMLDGAEAALYTAVLAGKSWAVCFFLKTQGKARGYVEKQEIDLNAARRLVIEEEIVDGPGDGGGDGSTQDPPVPQAG
jgi:hypothetical protein